MSSVELLTVEREIHITTPHTPHHTLLTWTTFSHADRKLLKHAGNVQIKY